MSKPSIGIESRSPPREWDGDVSGGCARKGRMPRPRPWWSASGVLPSAVIRPAPVTTQPSFMASNLPGERGGEEKACVVSTKRIGVGEDELKPSRPRLIGDAIDGALGIGLY